VLGHYRLSDRKAGTWSIKTYATLPRCSSLERVEEENEDGTG